MTPERAPQIGDVITYAGLTLKIISEPVLCSGVVDFGEIMPDFWSLDVEDPDGNVSNFCPDVSEVLAFS